MALTAFEVARSRGRRSRQALVGSNPYYLDYCRGERHFVVCRLAGKRQVFSRFTPEDEITPGADSRLSHTASVVWIAQEIAEALGLNAWLSSAIALVHDVAHCPYGHLGEKVVNEHLNTEQPGLVYDHVAVAPYLLQEASCYALDLCFETLYGATWHSLSSDVMTADVPEEYRVVAWADKIAYTLGDLLDALNVIGSGLFTRYTLLGPDEAADLANELRQKAAILGDCHEEVRDRLVSGLVAESTAAGTVRFCTSDTAIGFARLRQTLTDGLYSNTDLSEDIGRLHRVLELLVRSDIRSNPYFLFALLTDDELIALDHWSGQRSPGRILPKDVDRLAVADFVLPERDDFSFIAPDLSWGFS